MKWWIRYMYTYIYQWQERYYILLETNYEICLWQGFVTILWAIFCEQVLWHWFWDEALHLVLYSRHSDIDRWCLFCAADHFILFLSIHNDQWCDSDKALSHHLGPLQQASSRSRSILRAPGKCSGQPGNRLEKNQSISEKERRRNISRKKTLTMVFAVLV